MSASSQPDTTCLLFSICAADYIICLSLTHRNTHTTGCLKVGGEVWVGGKMNKDWKKVANREKKRVEEALNQETGKITARRRVAEL